MSLMGTRVFYNHVWIENCLTQEFAVVPQRDPSNSDIWYWGYHITVEGTIVASALNATREGGYNTKAVNTGTAMEILADTNPSLSAQQGAMLILNLLKRDRADFQYIQNGVVIISGGLANDCSNGPKVKDVRLTRISPAVFWVKFSIEVARADCEAGQLTPVPNVLGNRWTCADDIDENYMTTRTWRGVLRVSNPAVSPNDFRNLCLPKRQKGWRRVAMRFVVEQSGLELGYEIQDRLLVGEAAPSPAYSMTVTHRNVFTQMGGFGTGELTVRLSGGRGSDKREMLARASQIVRAKMTIPAVPAEKHDTRIVQLIITDYSSEHKNEVEAHCQTRRTLIPPGADTDPILIDAWGLPIASFNLDADKPEAQRYDAANPQTKSPYAAGGILGAFIAYQQNPCVDTHSIGANAQSPQQQPTSPADQTSEQSTEPVTSVTVYQGEPNNLLAPPITADSHQEFPYTYIRMESRFKSRFNRLLLPLSYAADDADDHSIAYLARPTTHRIVKYEAERTGDWPEIWNPDSFTAGGIKHTLLDREIVPRPKEQTVDGQTLYVIDATYVYGLSRTPKASDDWAIGSLPWDTQTTDDTKFPGSKFISPTDPHKGLGIDKADEQEDDEP